MMTKAVTLLLLFLLTLTFSNPVKAQGPQLLSYSELVSLYENDPPPPELASKLNRLLTTPFVGGSAGARNTVRTSEDNSLRVAMWNIERGLEFDAVKAALTNDQRFFRRLPAAMRGSK